MRIHLPTLAVTVLLGGAAVPPAVAQSSERVVYVNGSETGRGITRLRDRECFVIAPDHVVRGRGVGAGRFAPQDLHVVDSSRRRIPVTMATDYPADVAILRVDATDPRSASLCATWPSLGAINPTLRSFRGRGRTLGELVGRDENGGETRTPVVVTGVYDSHFTVRPEAGGQIQPGMSGSLVYVNGIPAGMLNAVTVGESASGIVYRLDYLEGIIKGYFQDIVPPSHGKILGSVLIPGMGQIATDRRGTGWALRGVTVAAAVGVALYPRVVTRYNIVTDAGGQQHRDPYLSRERAPLWVAGVVWVLGGTLSALEANGYSRRHYVGRDGGGRPAPGTVSARVAPRPAVVTDDGIAVSVLEVSF